MTESWGTIDRWAGGVLAVGAGITFALFAAVRPLADWDEGLYANIASEIARSGNWLLLILQGAPWFDKEPLGFWLMASTLKMFGWNLWALRLPALLAAVATAPIFYRLLRTRLPRSMAGVISLLFWTAPILWYRHMLGTADLEALTLLFSVAIPAAYVRWPTKTWPAVALFGIFLLTRGVWALPFLGFLIVGEGVQFWQTKDKRRVINFISAVMLAFVPWLAWHGLQYHTNPAEYVRVYWYEQFFKRISGEVDGHGGNWQFYWQFLRTQLGAGYAVLLLISALYVVVVARRSKDWLWAAWLLITIIPPHVLSTKLSWYSIPALPAMFAALGLGAQTVLDKKYVSPTLLGLIAAGLLVSGLAQTNYLYQYFKHSDQQVETIVAAAAPFVPPGSPMIVYGVRNWTFGRVLPALYWHAHSAHQWEIFNVSAGVAEHYVNQSVQYQWWWTTTSTLAELKTNTRFTGCVLATTTDYIFLTTVTNTPNCVSAP